MKSGFGALRGMQWQMMKILYCFLFLFVVRSPKKLKSLMWFTTPLTMSWLEQKL
jgi:hypothetical protein